MRRTLLTDLSGDPMEDSVEVEGRASTYLNESRTKLSDSHTDSLKRNTGKARKRQTLPSVGQEVKHSKTWVQDKRKKLLVSISSFEREINALERTKYKNKSHKTNTIWD